MSSETQTDGGPAFPTNPMAEAMRGLDDDSVHSGLSKREWFAGMALQGLCANPASADRLKGDIELLAFKIADAMLSHEPTQEPQPNG